MVDSVRIEVQERTEDGSSACRRLRRNGRIPAILYGLGRGNRKLSLVARQLDMLLTKGAHIVELTLGDKTQVALVKELQYDATGQNIVHADLQRIDRAIPVHVWVQVKFIGMAPTQAGATVDKIRDEIQVEVLPLEIPREFVVNLSNLQVGEHVTIGQLGLPEGCKPYHCTANDVVVVNHIRHVKEEAAAEQSVEPEVIGAKKPEEGAAPAAGAAAAKTEKKDAKKK